MTMTEKIFENRDLEVYYKNYDNNLLIISFNPLGTPAGGGAWGKKVFEKIQVSYIGFVSKSPNWFPEPSFEEALRAIKPLLAKFRTIITYGHSQGGYAALRFAKRLNANIILAFCPQYSISPRIMAGKDVRFITYFRDEQKQVSIKSHHVDKNAFAVIFYDETELEDKINADLIKQALPFVHLVNMANTGHQSVLVMAGSTKIKQLLQASVNKDIQAIKDLTQKYKRQWKERPIYLAMGLAKTRPTLAIQILEKNWDLLHSEGVVKIVLGLMQTSEKDFVFDNLHKFIAAMGNNLEAKRILISQIFEILNYQADYQRLGLQFFLWFWTEGFSDKTLKLLLDSDMYKETKGWFNSQHKLVNSKAAINFAIGWNPTEATCCWSKNRIAYLVINKKNVAKTNHFTLNTSLLAPNRQELTVSVYVNHAWEKLSITDGQIVIDLKNDYTIIKLEVTEVISPYELNMNNDGRKLGVAVGLPN